MSDDKVVVLRHGAVPEAGVPDPDIVAALKEALALAESGAAEIQESYLCQQIYVEKSQPQRYIVRTPNRNLGKNCLALTSKGGTIIVSAELERAANALFPSTGNEVGNVKFMRGHNRQVTAEQIAEQFNRAEAQVANGLVSPVDNIDDD